MSDELRALYEEVHALTHAACQGCADSAATLPNRCCDPAACENARRWAAIKGVTLQETGHPTLPFMGKDGCVLDITLKPSCTLFCCDGTECKSSLRYGQLVQRIIELEGDDWRKYLDR